MTNLSRKSLVMLAVAAVVLAALIFGLGGGVSFGNVVIWLVMLAAVGSAILLYAKSSSGTGHGGSGPKA